MSDLSRFLKELDEQAHNDSVFSMFDDFDKKYADFTAREREWQEAFDAERKRKDRENQPVSTVGRTYPGRVRKSLDAGIK